MNGRTSVMKDHQMVNRPFIKPSSNSHFELFYFFLIFLFWNLFSGLEHIGNFYVEEDGWRGGESACVNHGKEAGKVTVPCRCVHQSGGGRLVEKGGVKYKLGL